MNCVFALNSLNLSTTYSDVYFFTDLNFIFFEEIFLLGIFRYHLSCLWIHLRDKSFLYIKSSPTTPQFSPLLKPWHPPNIYSRTCLLRHIISANLMTLSTSLRVSWRWLTEADFLKTYYNWSGSTKQTPQKLSEAGFFRTQKKDSVICFSCGGDLFDWNGENPWEQHA